MPFISYFYIIPAYEPDLKIVNLIQELLQDSEAYLCIVNDGSQNMLLFENPIFRDKRIILLHHATNLGKGAALKTAFNYLLLHFPSLKGVVTLDADGQHAVRDAIKIAQHIQWTPALILGTRGFALLDKRVPFKSRIGNVLTRCIWRLLMGSTLSDTQTGLRGIPPALMKACLHILPNRYEFEMEMLLKAGEMGIPIKEIPIQTIYINQNRGSHFNPFFDSLKIYFVLFRFSFSAFLSTLVDYGAFYFFSTFLKGGASFVLARLISFFLNYQLNRQFVFRKKKKFSKTFLKYLCLFIINLYIGYSFVEFVSFDGIPALYAKIIIDLVLFFFNFFAQREWVFRNRLAESD